MKLVFRLFVSSLLCLPGVFAQAQIAEGPSQPEALELLGRIEQSLSAVSYEGIYTYEHTGVMDSIKVSKVVTDAQTSSRMEHLSGRESKVIVHTAAKQSCDLDLSQRQSVFDKDNLSNYYRFSSLGDERIAGRNTIMLQAEPRDDFRFGYRLAVDSETYVPLLLALVSGNRLVERFQFVDFKPLDSSTLSEPLEAHPDDHILAGACADAAQTAQWRLDWMPGGFKLVAVKSDESTNMFSYSDGLSRVSVFISETPGGATLEGEARRGGTIVYLDKVLAAGKVYQVSVVGEIPKVTAQKIAGSVKMK